MILPFQSTLIPSAFQHLTTSMLSAFGRKIKISLRSLIQLQEKKMNFFFTRFRKLTYLCTVNKSLKL